MNKIRCVVAGVSHIMLADIMHRIAEQDLNIEFVNSIGEEDLSLHIKQLGIDAVITSFDATGFPTSHIELLDQVSDVAVVGLVDDGRKLCVCVDDAGPAEIIGLIRAAVEGKWEKRE